jgi:dihydrofolate reductase
MRPRVSVYLALSLDGRIARPDGTLDWLARVQDPADDHGYAAFMATVDAVVMGRTTHDAILAFGLPDWPFAGTRTVVCTTRPLAPHDGVETHAGDLAPLIARLGDAGVRRVYLDGGRTVQQGLRDGLVDDLTLSVVPVVLGRGIPLFTDDLPESDWRLTGTHSHPTGLVQLRYERAPATT